MKSIAVFVEGHGEVAAADKLVTRLSQAIGKPLRVRQTLRWKNLHRKDGLERAVHYARTLGVSGTLLIRDEDDACPKDTAPRDAAILRASAPSSPTAILLMCREYEVVFLPSLHSIAGKSIAGRPGLLPDTRWSGPWESKRDVKGWLTDHMPPGRAYKPTLDQLPMTLMLDIDALLRSDVPSIGSLTRAITFLHDAETGVYPVG